MRPFISKSTEDYLKIIYNLTVMQERASTNQIANALNVKPASVTGMIQKLSNSEPPLVDYQKHQGVSLTLEGEKVALEIIRHHRLLETFLHETLGYEWDSVHAEADRLEHVISEEFEERIAQALGDPTHDPHGDPIPNRDLQMPTQATTRLSELRKGQQAIIQRVPDSNPDLLRFLGEHGIIPGACIEVVAYSDFDDNLSIRVQNRSEISVLGIRVTRKIYIMEIS
jgi:DtxR family Mn-dependent transcriptional regulator